MEEVELVDQSSIYLHEEMIHSFLLISRFSLEESKQMIIQLIAVTLVIHSLRWILNWFVSKTYVCIERGVLKVLGICMLLRSYDIMNKWKVDNIGLASDSWYRVKKDNNLGIKYMLIYFQFAAVLFFTHCIQSVQMDCSS